MPDIVAIQTIRLLNRTFRPIVPQKPTTAGSLEKTGPPPPSGDCLDYATGSLTASNYYFNHPSTATDGILTILPN